MRVFVMQRLTAVALVLFLTLHMIVVHYPPGHLDFSRVMERLANPVWKLIDILFLAAVLVHALTGMYAVLMDVERVTPYKRALIGGAMVLGVVAFVYGTITVINFSLPAEVAIR
jgi:succinate dehydrogenase / fumarate reductase, membrane anchor subunit